MAQKQILTVVTGSRLHGLNTPESDTDYRGIFMNDLSDVLNPFMKVPDTRWIEGQTQDDTSYELSKFVKETVHGNPNFIEILFSNQVVLKTPEGQELRVNRERFVDSQRIFEAFKGYASNQLNKMELFTPDKRTPKFAVAYIRSLLNGIELLSYGTITNPVPAYLMLRNGDLITARQSLLDIKFCPPEEFDKVRDLCISLFSRLQNALSDAYYNTPRHTADIEWIGNFVKEAYLQ